MALATRTIRPEISAVDPAAVPWQIGSRAWAQQPLMPVTLAQLRELVPQAQLVEIPGTAHFAHLDAPDLFHQQLDVFIEGPSALTQ